MNTWQATLETEKIGVVKYTWKTNTPPTQDIILDIGQRIYLIQKMDGWYYALLLQGSLKLYVTVPQNYVKIIPSNKIPSHKNKLIYYEPDMLSQLIFTVLTSWVESAKHVDKYFPIERLNFLIRDLLKIRKDLTEPTFKRNISAIVDLINEGNQYLNLDNMPVIEDKIMDGSTTNYDQIFSYQYKNGEKSNTKSENAQDSFTSEKTLLKDKEQHNLYICLESAFCELWDSSCWFIGIYDSTNDSYISEKFIMNIRESFLDREASKIAQAALFEITNANIMHNLYLFIKIYRIGGLTNERKIESGAAYKRPYAFSAIALKDLKKLENEGIKNERTPILICDDTEFGFAERSYTKETLLTAKQTLTLGYYVEYSLKYFNDSLANIKYKNSEIFTEDTFIIPYIGFPDIMDPDLKQCDFHLTLKSVALDKLISKGKMLNIEATVSVWNNMGQLQSNCIKIGNGKDITYETEYKTAVMYHTNQPSWNETISLVFGTKKLENHQILILLQHISSNAGKSKVGKMTQVGLTAIKLENNNQTIIDTSEATFFIKKIDSHGSGKGSSSQITDDVKKLGQVLKERYGTADVTPDDTNKYSFNDVLKVKARLYSTTHTSSDDVIVLKTMYDNEFPDMKPIMHTFQFIPPSEIAKFIKPIFQNIVAMLVPRTDTTEESLYFQALSRIFTIVSERKFRQYEGKLIEAIQTTKMPKCWKTIIIIMNSSISKLIFSVTGIFYENIKAFIGNLNLISKVLLKSFDDFKSIEKDTTESISNDLVKVFVELFKIFDSDNSPHLFPLQVKILNNFMSLFIEMKNTFSFEQIALMTDSLLYQLPLCDEGDSATILNFKSIMLYKVRFLSKLIDSDTFKIREFRRVLKPVISKNIKIYLDSQFKTNEICIEIACVFINILKYTDNDEDDKVIRNLVCDFITNFMNDNKNLVNPNAENSEKNSLSVLLSLLSLMDQNGFFEYFSSLTPECRRKNLTKWYTIFYNIFHVKYFPPTYTVEWLTLCRVLLIITKNLFEILKQIFTIVSSDPSRIQLIHSFFDFALEFINCPRLSYNNSVNIYLVEHISSQKDMRVQMAEILFDLWGELDHDDVAHLYHYAQKLVTTSLIDLPDLRNVMFRILYDFLIFDYKSSHSMDNVTRIIISYIDSDSYTHDRYQAFSDDFKKIMEFLWTKYPDNEVQRVGRIATGQIIEIIDTLAYYSLPEKFENCVFLQAFRSHQMIEYHTRIGHSQMIQLNIAQLLRSNQLMDAYTETGMCYLKLAQNYSWDFSTQLPALSNFEPSTPAARKEKFLLQTIEFFEKGFNLEMAIESCKELLPLYEIHKIDYIKLSNLHKRISELVERVAKGESSIDNYYRVIFIGRDFPKSIQNKSYICHMGSCATLGNTISFLKRHFPNANIPLTSTYDEKLCNENVQYIFVQAFQPLPKDNDIYEKFYEASETVARYYKNANTNKFQGIISCEQKKNDPSPPSFIKTLSKVAYTLPNIIMISPIGEEEKSIMNDFEQNLDLVNNNSKDLLDLCRNYSLNPSLLKNIQMKLSGCLNAFVNGGLSLILPKYFCDTFINENPENTAKLELMRKALIKFMLSNATAMKILVNNCSDEMTGFVVNLCESYEMTRQSLIQKANVDSEDLTYLLLQGTSVGGSASSGYASSTRGSSMRTGSINDLNNSTQSPRRDTVISLENAKKDRGATISKMAGKPFKALSKTQLFDDDSKEKLLDTNLEKTPLGDSRDSNVGASDRFKKKYGFFSKKK